MTVARRALLVALAVAAILAVAAGRPHEASAQCILSATYLGAPYTGVGAVPASEVLGPAGPGTLPPCNDVITVPPRPVDTTPIPIVLYRLRGVAPRLAVTVAPSGGQGGLLVADSAGCRRATLTGVLACLRARTRVLVRGPSLIAYPSARPGDVITLTVHVRDARLRRRTSSGIDSLLQRRDDTGRWRSLYHLLHPTPGNVAPPQPVAVGPVFGRVQIAFTAGFPHPVRLPVVAPGRYRIAQSVLTIGRRERWLFAPLSIVAP